jgi:hypothetical protein
VVFDEANDKLTDAAGGILPLPVRTLRRRISIEFHFPEA